MKSATKISIAVFFVFTTLMGSVGFSLHKMACYESGNITLALEKSFCCPSDEQDVPPNSLAAVCCGFDQLEFKVSSFDINEHPSVNVFMLPPVPNVPLNLSTAATPLNYEKFIPPLRNPQRLALLCTYRI